MAGSAHLIASNHQTERRIAPWLQRNSLCCRRLWPRACGASNKSANKERRTRLCLLHRDRQHRGQNKPESRYKRAFDVFILWLPAQGADLLSKTASVLFATLLGA